MNEAQQKEAIATLAQAGFCIVPKVVATLNRHYEDSGHKLVLVMSHTCTHDFLLGLLVFGSGAIPITMFTHFKSPFLIGLAKKFGMITYQKGVSNTKRAIEVLKQKGRFALLIGLAKTRLNRRIHSGYFYIAQALQARIVVLGFDYYNHSGYVSESHWLPEPNQTYEEFAQIHQPGIVDEIQEIYPLYPELQVAFDPAKYRVHEHQRPFLKSSAPSRAFLYALLAKDQVRRHVPTPLLIVLFVLLLMLLLFLILILARHRKKQTRS
jgi:hypothetical protein